MKVLLLTSKPIYPVVDGGCFASRQFLKTLLHAGADVRHLTIATDKHPFSESDYPKDIHSATQPKSVYINTAVRPVAALSSLIRGKSYNIRRFFALKMVHLIEETLADFKPECVIFDGLYTTPYLEVIRKSHPGKIFLRSHNAEFKLWKKYADEAKGIKRIYLKKLHRDLKKYECELLSQVDAIFALSSEDITVFQACNPEVKAHLVPVAIETQDQPFVGTTNDFYHVGAMNWLPNIQAVKMLVDVFRNVRKRMPNADLHIAGLKSDTIVKSNEDKGIHVHGFVSDMDAFGKEHGTLVTPILSGSGIRIKILEAMALGKAVITTPTGALGIDYHSQNCLIVAEQPEELEEKMIEILENPHLRQQIGENAFQYIRDHHTIHDISKQVIELLKSE